MNNKILNSMAALACLLSFSGNVNATNYYVDPNGDNNLNDGLSINTPWQTLSHVNSVTTFVAGDKVYLKRGSVFRETLTPKVSGMEYGAYGTGVNPEIRRTELFSDWQPYPEGTNIWKGNIAGVKNSAGATHATGLMKRINSYNPCVRLDQVPEGTIVLPPDADPEKYCMVYKEPMTLPMEDETFYATLNGSVFYMRSDDGNPGAVEVGARPYAIHIDGVSDIIISDIDVFGPAGKDVSKCCSGLLPILISNANNITIKDLSIHGAQSTGVTADELSSNITYNNIHAYDNGGTALYLHSNGGFIMHSLVHDNARLSKDIGDRGGIGVLRASNIVISSNKVFRNGQDNDGYPDFEISVVLAPGPVYIVNNFVKECVQGCIQIAQGGHNSFILNNVISGFATATGRISSLGKLAGIRIGGGDSGSNNVTIDNNYIESGHATTSLTHAAIYLSQFESPGFTITNNKFYNNNGVDIYVHENADITGATVDNNTYINSNSNTNWYFKGLFISTLENWQLNTGWDQLSESMVIE